MNRRNVAFGVALFAIVFVVSGLLVEVVLRVYSGAAETELAEALRRDPFNVLVEPHGEAGFRPRPDVTLRYPHVDAEAHINSMGFRGPTVSLSKPPGVIRVVLLGGSTTFGWGVEDDETIDAYMRPLLAERYPDLEIEVVNLAFDGYDSYQLFERLRTDVLAYEPDFLIVNTGINDVHNAWFEDIRDGDRRTLLYRATIDQMRLEMERGGPTLWTRIKHWFYAARLPGWIAQQSRFAENLAAAADRPPAPTHWDALDYFERNLRRIVALQMAESSSAVVLFSTPPSAILTFEGAPPASYWLHDIELTQVYRDSLSVRMQHVATQEAGEGHAVAFVPHEELPPTYFLDDTHLTPEGNRLIAEDFVQALAPWLRERRFGGRP